jgi:PAT family beta-lactamase induction signal transducer AmpG
LIMALCDQEYSAAQFALLTALTSIGRVYLGPPAAILVDHVGWIWFYLISCFVGLPGVFLLFSIRKVIREAGSQ